jgi:hypothetical protein
MSDAISSAALPYHEPGVVAILILTSFLLLLNALNYALDRIVYCGLVGQILIGIAWGTPGAKWLGAASEQFIVQLGYLGLILLVYEGILTSSLFDSVDCLFVNGPNSSLWLVGHERLSRLNELLHLLFLPFFEVSMTGFLSMQNQLPSIASVLTIPFQLNKI